ncbi:hypothetical protein ECZU17_38900 [Escherichia coli]|nr:hypothetical protein ECZU17_38900 [Escherichia coli]
MATVNKQAIAAAFGRAAAHYEQHADLQRQSADVLLAMLPQRKYTHVLDAGCGLLDEPPLAGTSRAGDGVRSLAANACSGTPEGCRRPLSGGRNSDECDRHNSR